MVMNQYTNSFIKVIYNKKLIIFKVNCWIIMKRLSIAGN